MTVGNVAFFFFLIKKYNNFQSVKLKLVSKFDVELKKKLDDVMRKGVQ